MGENHFAAASLALYGGVLLMAALAYSLLQRALILHHGRDSLLARAIGKDLKGKLSPLFYALAIPLAFVARWISGGLYVVVAVMWLLPDRRIEARLTEAAPHEQ